MRILLFYFFGFIAVGCVGQTQLKKFDVIERHTVRRKKLLVRFEKVDTIDENGRRLEVSRSYYFDKDRKNLVLITANENQLRPRTGFLLWYTFSNNKLMKVTAIPSRKVCSRCNAEYYFSNDSLIYKNEQNYSAKNVCSFVDDSRKLSSKVLRKDK